MDSTAKTSVYTIPTIPKCLQSSGLHVVHLVDEVKLGGLVPYRWMYSIERYLGHLKSFVRNRTNPESSIAEGYIAEECLTFCSRYLDGVETRFNRSRRVDDVPFVASNRDTHGVFGDVAYYGKLVDIIELNYYSKFVVTQFKCIWADTTPRGIRRDSYGFTEVNFSRTIHVGDSIDDEPYVLAEQAQMVFYVTNEMEKDWNVAIPFKPRDFFDMGENVDSSVYDCTSISSENQNPMVLNEIENLQLTREKLNDEITIIVDSGIERANND
nr:uncharacterized protein LOC109190818 [Ipomoea batatas]